MYRQDYILRMIEMLADLIAGILGLIRKGEFQKAAQFLDNAYYDILKHDVAFFQSIPTNELTNKLLDEHHFTNGHLEILSELFYAQAELSDAQENHISSLEFYEKSLALLEFIITHSKTFSLEKQSRLSLIQNKIAEHKSKTF